MSRLRLSVLALGLLAAGGAFLLVEQFVSPASPVAVTQEASRKPVLQRTMRAVSVRKQERLSSLRTADSSHAAALFATHSWYVAPPPPPRPPAPPPPQPEAPPFPYTFVGSYAPDGEAAVYFLARADRVIDAHVGDHVDGVYLFESAGSNNLVFTYLPLNVRQSLSTGVSP